MPFAAFAVPENQQFWGIGRELVVGTAIAPVLSIPLDKGQPDDKPTMLKDNNVRGFMGEDYGDIQGVEIADFPISGNVYLDAIGHLFFNLFGDYQAVGSTPTSATTVAAATAAGATSFTVGAIGSIVIGSVLQFGNATLGTAPTENLVVSNVAGSVVTFANTPTRFAHSTSAAVAIVSAPYTHTFSLLNSSNGQPPTHTISYHNNLAVSTLARQYAYWCTSGIDLKMNSEQLFMHDTKGTSVLGAIAGVAPINVQSGSPAIPNWEFKVGIGGPASGGTLVQTIEDAQINYARGLKVKYTLQGAQTPWIIARLGLTATGKFTVVAQDESPLIALLNNTQPSLQFVMTQGAGANTLGVTFNFQVAAYEAAPIQAPDLLTYDVSFRAIMNTTNAGFSGGQSVGNVILVNAVSTY